MHPSLHDPREYVAVSKAARMLHLSGQRVRQLFDEGALPGFRDGEGHRRIHRESLVAAALRRQVHQLMTGALKTGPKGPRRPAAVPAPRPTAYQREFEAATA